MSLSNPNDYGPKKEGCRFVLAVVDIFTKYGWTVSKKNTCRNSNLVFGKFSYLLKETWHLTATDDGELFMIKFFTDFSKKYQQKIYLMLPPGMQSLLKDFLALLRFSLKIEGKNPMWFFKRDLTIERNTTTK